MKDLYNRKTMYYSFIVAYVDVIHMHIYMYIHTEQEIEEER